MCVRCASTSASRFCIVIIGHLSSHGIMYDRIGISVIARTLEYPAPFSDFTVSAMILDGTAAVGVRKFDYSRIGLDGFAKLKDSCREVLWAREAKHEAKHMAKHEAKSVSWEHSHKQFFVHCEHSFTLKHALPWPVFNLASGTTFITSNQGEEADLS